MFNKKSVVPLYKRSTWQRELDESKIDMGLIPDYNQDDLDHSLFCAVREENLCAIYDMVEAGANPNLSMKPKDGDTLCSLLHIAALTGNIKVVQALLEGGADPMKLDSTGLTAGDYALKHRHNARVKALLKRWEKKITDPLNDDFPISFSEFSDQKKAVEK